jgi:Contractile injection system tube protein/LysM domain
VSVGVPEAGSAPPTGAAAQPAGGSQSAPAGALHRARLTCKETGDGLDVHYNPNQVRLNKAVVLTAAAQQAAPHGSPPHFINTHTRTLTFQLTLDAWSTGKDVTAAVTQIQSWMNPTTESLQPGHTPAPATIEFEWWNDPEPFVGVIAQANATYTLFDSTGLPVRATVDISISELPQTPPRQNPTSGSPGGGRSVLVREGDTLAGIAYRQYGDPTLWRGLALANHITDPLALKPGTRVLLPAASTLRGVSS